MQNQWVASLLMRVSVGVLALTAPALSESVPTFFILRSASGSETLRASCDPVQRTGQQVTDIKCNFQHVRLDTKDAESGALEQLKRIRAELQKDGKSDVEIAKEVDTLRRGLCTSIAGFDQMVLGTKTRLILANLNKACAGGDMSAIVQLLDDWNRRTCKLWVDGFELQFKRTSEGQWLFRQDTPGLLTRVLKIYELAQSENTWSLTETRVPTKGSDESLTRTVWTSRELGFYELPCEFLE